MENNQSKNELDVQAIRRDFPILASLSHGKPLVYLDNAATTQKPKSVIDTLTEYYSASNSNIHRGVHYLSQKATDKYEATRSTVQKFINARSTKEIIFTRGTTESINLVAGTYGRVNIGSGDEVLITTMEHHSNIVPWQILCEEKNARLRVVPISDSGEIDIQEFENLLSERTRLVSIVHISNSLGTINPVKELIRRAHKYRIPVLIDGAQAIQHVPVDVQDLDCEFYAFSGHKIYGPTGIGVLYGKESYLDSMPPYQGGGDMIKSVSFEKTLYADLPHKFEAGTPNIAGTIGLDTAIKYVQSIGFDNITLYEKQLLDYATESVFGIKGLSIIGTARDKASVLSFVLDGIHPHDIGTFLDMDGVAVRTGHHCTEPIMKRYNIPATTRASFAFYNTTDEIDVLIKSIKNVIKMFR